MAVFPFLRIYSCKADASAPGTRRVDYRIMGKQRPRGRRKMATTAAVMRGGILCCLLLACMAAPAAGAAAQEPVYDIEIPRLSLDAALNQLARQTGTQLLFPYDLVSELETDPVSGDYTVMQALAILLRGTGLSSSLTQSGVITVAQQPAEQPGEPEGEMNKTITSKNRSGFLAGLSVVMTALFGANAATGQETAGAGAGVMLEEIVVTAQKREQSLQDIGIAVTALSGDRLVDAQVTNVQDLQYLVPGLTIGESFGFSQIMIRGVGTDNPFSGGDPSVAMHVDGVVIGQSSAQFGSLFDIQRIEVLRGPQGTLYGRNTTGGSINVITHKPTEELTGYGRFTAGNDTLLKFEGGVGGGIADNLLGRVAVKIEERDGYGRNLFDGSDIDDASRQSARMQLHWIASSDVDFLLAAEYHQEDDTNYMPKFRAPSFPDTTIPALLPQPVGAAHAPRPRDVIADTPIQNERDQWSLAGTLNWQLDERFKLSSITSYQEFTKDPQQDFDTTGEPRFSQAERIDTSQFSQELQLHYDDGMFSGILGLYYYNEEIKSDNRLISNAALVPGLNDAITLPDAQLSLHFRGAVNAEAAAVFANLNIALTDTLNVILGGRYSYENRKGFSDRVKTPPPFAPARTFADEGSFNDFTPKAGIEWKATDDLMLYFTYTEGFKSGVLLSGQENPLLEPETVESFEFGAKGRFLNDRLQLNLAVFTYDFTDLQVGRSLPSPGGFVLVFENAAAAEIEGVEIETTWLATDQLRFDASLTWLDAKYEDFLTRDPFDLALEFFGGPTALPEQLAGNRLPQAPEWAWTVRGEYSFSTPVQGWNGVLGIDVAYKDDIFFTSQNFIGSLGQGSETTLNANLKFTSADDTWYLNLWGKNLTDELIYTGAFIINTTRVNMGMLAPPRTFGATLGYNF